MSTIRKVIERIDTNKPNAFTTENKVAWLAELDGKITADVFLMDVSEVRQFTYDPEADLDTELLVRFPHDDIYYYWLSAKIDAENGEYDKYQNTMQLYNASYNNFVNWFLDAYEPAQGCGGNFSRRRNRPSYYITAYGLAVKRGFEGTIDEWLASLIGKSAYCYAQEAGYTGTEEELSARLAYHPVLYVTISTGTAAEYVADKTFAEVTAQLANHCGVKCRLTYNGASLVLDVCRAHDGAVWFSTIYNASVMVRVQLKSDETVTVGTVALSSGGSGSYANAEEVAF